MLLVFLLLQFMPAPAREAVAARAGHLHGWSQVQTELDSQWQVANGRPESQPVSITLTQLSPPTEWRSVLKDAPEAPPAALSFADALPAATPIHTWTAPESDEASILPAVELASDNGPVIVPYLLGNLNHTIGTAMLLAAADPPTPEDPGGGIGGPGGGIGSPVPEPSVISLALLGLPLISRRRRAKENPAK